MWTGITLCKDAKHFCCQFEVFSNSFWFNFKLAKCTIYFQKQSISTLVLNSKQSKTSIKTAWIDKTSMRKKQSERNAFVDESTVDAFSASSHQLWVLTTTTDFE